MNSAPAAAPTALITDTEVAEMCLPMRSPSSTSLLEFLCERNEELRERIGALVAVLKVSQFVSQEQIELPELPKQSSEEGKGQGEGEEKSGFESDLAQMQSRLTQMETVEWGNTSPMHTGSDEADEVWEDTPADNLAAAPSTAARDDSVAAIVGVESKQGMPQGWSLAPESWKPTPFGCLNGRIPNLVLDL